MIAKTVAELLRSWYGRPKDEFLAAYTSPVLVGVGVLDAKLLRNPHRDVSTLCLALERARDVTDTPPHPLVGTIIPVACPSGHERRSLLVGRVAPANIIVDDRSVSERHCVLEPRGSRILVADLGSTNGTMINGTVLEPPLAHTLRDEDVLTLGRHSFQYFTPEILFTYLQLCPPPR